jgi:hypothetical protein
MISEKSICSNASSSSSSSTTNSIKTVDYIILSR